MMNSRERMLAAMSERPSDRVPVAPCYPNIYLRRFEYQAYVERYRARMGNHSEYGVTPAEDSQIIFESKLESFKAWQEMPDWIGVTRGPARATQMHSVVRERDGEYLLVDTSQETETNLSALARGETNELAFGRMHELATSRELSAAEVDARIPVVSMQALLDSGAFEVARRVIEQYQGHLFLHAVLSTPYTSTKYTVGFDNLLTGLRTRPDLIRHVVERHRQAAEPLLEAWAALGIDGIFFQETLSGADFISPADYDAFVFPANHHLFKRCQALGLKAIYYITGDIRARLPRILEAAPDALAFEESRKDYVLDLAHIRARAGDSLCLFGNVDVYQVLERGSDDDLHAEILRQLRAGRTSEGAFILGLGSPITPDTSPGRVGRFIRLCRELGQ